MLIDRDKALGRFDGQDELYLKLAGYFIRDYTDFPERIKTLVDSGDRDAYVLIHSLKNIAASLGADSLSAKALKLEGYLKRNCFEEGIPILEQVLIEFAPVLEEIKSLPSEKESRPDRGPDRNRDGGHDNYESLLRMLSEALGSFSPCEVARAVKMVRLSWDAVPPDQREFLGELLELAEDFRYLEGEDKLSEWLNR